MSIAEVDTPEQAPRGPAKPAKHPRIAFALTADKKIRIALLNVLYVLEQHPAWTGSLGFDELLNDVVLKKRPPYLSDTGPWRIRPITEQDHRETANWLQRTYGLYVASTLAGEGLTTYAARFPFHPIRTYLAGLTWDGEERLDAWLSTYCHVVFTPFTRAVASKTLIAAVARVYEPGCKVDTMTILEGPQGTLKSTVWNILASDAYFTDWLPDLHDKDAMQALCGKWFIEFGELSNFQRSEVETVKRFVSAKQDHYRPSYGKKAQTFPRQNIFVGSTNEDHYFKDSTGNRRFWPVKMGGDADIAGLARDRDQLWAEAVTRYHQGELWYLTGALAQAAACQQAQRVELDDWEDQVIDYITTSKHTSPDGAFHYVTTKDILCEAFRLDPLHWTQANTKRLGGILRRNGWTARPVWNIDNTKQFKAFVKAAPQQKATPVPSVTGNNGEKAPTGNSESRSNDASVTHVTGVTCLTGIGEGQEHFSLYRKLPVTTGNGVTPVTDSEPPSGVSPTTNGSGPGVSGATFPPGQPSQDEAGEVPSRVPSEAPVGLALDGFSHANILPSPGGNGAAGACALAVAMDAPPLPPRWCPGCDRELFDKEHKTSIWLTRPQAWECPACRHKAVLS